MVFSSSAFAQVNNTDIVVSLGNVSITVRGSGGYVCSAQDTFKKLPRLGRGATMADAEMNARYLAALTAGGSDFFVKIISCEKSQTGAGQITIQNDERGLRVVVAGGSQVECAATDSFHNKNLFYIAEAATQTEASALASEACTVANNSGFFCETTCNRIAKPVVKQPGIKLPKIRIRL